MSDISPFSTLISCGSSSILVLLTNLPTLVSRFASDNNLPFSSRSSVIVLNLITLNILTFLPGLSWKKNAPAPLFAKCSQMVTTNKIGLIQIRTISEIQKSKRRLKKCLYMLTQKKIMLQRFHAYVLSSNIGDILARLESKALLTDSATVNVPHAIIYA